MLCDECGQNQATIHIATIIGGKKKDENLCPQCWQKRNAQILGGLSVGNLLSQLLGAQPQQEEDKTVRAEDFERAAELRDRIRALDKGQPVAGGEGEEA